MKFSGKFFKVSIAAGKENSFKHGKSAEGILNIKWKLEIIEDQLLFLLKNSVPARKEILDQNSGIGLENIQKRLKYIYGEAYGLEVITTKKSYSVLLKIPINF